MSDISKIQVGGTSYNIKDESARQFINQKVSEINSSNGNSNDYIPSTKAVYDYINNLKTTYLSSSSDDNHFPTAQAVYSYIQNNLNNNSSSNTLTFSNDYSDYYAIKTIHFDLTTLDENNIVMNSLYKISDYFEINGLYRVTTEEGSSDATLVNLGALMFGINDPVYYGVSMYGAFIIFPQDTFLEEILIPAGMYLPTEDSPQIGSITHFVKKDNYIVQKSFNPSLDSELILNTYIKVSDEIDLNGLYSAFGISIEMNNNAPKISLNYDTGGYFEPVEQHYPETGLSGVYVLPSNFLLHTEANIPIAIMVINEFIIPAGFMGSEEDITVLPGLYTLYNDELEYLGICFNLVKLQDKETILNLDEIFGTEISEFGSILETILGKVETNLGSTSFTLTTNEISNDDEIQIIPTEQWSTKKIYDILKAAYENKGSIKLQMGVGSYLDMIGAADLFKASSNFCLLYNTSLYDATWLNSHMQIYSSENVFEIYIKCSVEQ